MLSVGDRVIVVKGRFAGAKGSIIGGRWLVKLDAPLPSFAVRMGDTILEKYFDENDLEKLEKRHYSLDAMSRYMLRWKRKVQKNRTWTVCGCCGRLISWEPKFCSDSCKQNFRPEDEVEREIELEIKREIDAEHDLSSNKTKEGT